jgi:hypothetical protein
MRRFLFTLFLLVTGGLFANAQENPPYWVNQLPKPENGTYYFRVTHAEELTYEKAYVQAFSMAILESSWKMGLPVDAKNDLATIVQGVENNLSIRSHQSHIAINKVCEWQTKNITSNKIVLYVLWQVASSGNIEADFGYFEKCK